MPLVWLPHLVSRDTRITSSSIFASLVWCYFLNDTMQYNTVLASCCEPAFIGHTLNFCMPCSGDAAKLSLTVT